MSGTSPRARGCAARSRASRGARGVRVDVRGRGTVSRCARSLPKTVHPARRLFSAEGSGGTASHPTPRLRANQPPRVPGGPRGLRGASPVLGRGSRRGSRRVARRRGGGRCRFEAAGAARAAHLPPPGRRGGAARGVNEIYGLCARSIPSRASTTSSPCGRPSARTTSTTPASECNVNRSRRRRRRRRAERFPVAMARE